MKRVEVTYFPFFKVHTYLRRGIFLGRDLTNALKHVSQLLFEVLRELKFCFLSLKIFDCHFGYLSFCRNKLSKYEPAKYIYIPYLMRVKIKIYPKNTSVIHFYLISSLNIATRCIYLQHISCQLSLKYTRILRKKSTHMQHTTECSAAKRNKVLQNNTCE